MVYCVGLTGTIGSGKSTVATCFQQLHIEVINADNIAKSLTRPNQPAFAQIVEHFGPSILTKQGELNRRLLFNLLIQEKETRLWLNQLLHPLILKEMECKVGQLQSPYGMIEIPLLENKSLYPYLNRILLVKTSTELQIMRIMTRYDCSEVEAKNIIYTQSSTHVLQDKADDVLMNDGSLLYLQEKIEYLNQFYLQLANSSPRIKSLPS